jgi:hypothetical protein
MFILACFHANVSISSDNRHEIILLILMMDFSLKKQAAIDTQSEQFSPPFM